MMLTGWSVAPLGDKNPGFRFVVDRHQPGTKPFMGFSYSEGLAGGEMALMWLACHQATYRHIAMKLARHLMSDTPTPDAIERIANVLCETGGDLRAAALALLDMPEAWRPLTKHRTPIDTAIAIYRALELQPETYPSPAGLAQALGQPLWGAPLPNGWPDVAAPWSSGEAALRIADWAFEIARRLPDADAEQIGDHALGPLLGSDTRIALRGIASSREAIAMLVTSREFQRR
jgi:uncharacterized protein (DUF1800 family)